MLGDYIKQLMHDGYRLVLEELIDFNSGPVLHITLSKDRQKTQVYLQPEDFSRSALLADNILMTVIQNMEKSFSDI